MAFPGPHEKYKMQIWGVRRGPDPAPQAHGPMVPWAQWPLDGRRGALGQGPWALPLGPLYECAVALLSLGGPITDIILSLRVSVLAPTFHLGQLGAACICIVPTSEYNAR